MMSVRRVLSALVLGLVMAFGSAGTAVFAETPSAPASASATPSSSADTAAGTDTETPDLPQDNSRQILAIGGAAGLALIAALVVFLRRR